MVLSDLENVLMSLQNAALEDVPGVSKVDSDIEDILKSFVPNVAVIGVGGAGCNTITNLWNSNLRKESHVRLVAVNTDARQLYYNTQAHIKVLIGKTTCRGFGAGNDPATGEAAANESSDKIKQLLTDTHLAFITCGLGGGTGSGAAPVIASIAKELGVPTVAVCTLPFQAEGDYRLRNAEYAIKRLKSSVDAMILIPNDKLLLIAPNKSILEAFKVIDDFLVDAFTGIIDVIYKTGIVNVDFSDVLRVIKAGNSALITVGKATSSEENKAEAAVRKAFNNPLLSDIRIDTAKSILINVAGGDDLKLNEVMQVMEALRSVIRMDDSEMKWGFMIERGLKGTVKVVVLMAGIRLPYIDEAGNIIRPKLIASPESLPSIEIPIPTL